MNIIPLLQKKPDLWDLFTRKEEYQSPILDQYDRFPYYASKNRDILEPVVSKYLIENGYHQEYPDGKQFALCLTHDIDILYESKITKAMESLSQLSKARLAGCLKSLAKIRSKKLPWWNFSDILGLEARYDAKSSFFFMV